MRTAICKLFVLLLLPGTLSNAVAQNTAHTAVPYPTAGMAAGIDRGALVAQSSAAQISVTLILPLSDPKGAETLLQAINTPGNSQFHQFLTADQFSERFAPSESDVANVAAKLAGRGLKVERTTALTLKATGSPAAMEQAFGVSLHNYEVSARGTTPGYTYYSPLTAAKIPADIAASVAGVVGLDSRPSLYPHVKESPRGLARPKPSASPSSSQGNQPGLWTVTDFAKYYDIKPLYNGGLTGKGRTIGILTFASFTPSDAFAYWKAVGLTVASNRLSIVNVDGGPGAPSDKSGSIETTLDVEQSGGIAPAARVMVYQAPNTNQGFIDIFAESVDANTADSLSMSWGGWEWFDNLENSPITDPFTGKTTSALRGAHELLVRAAIQGQSVFTSSGDGGAYEQTNDDGCFLFTSPSCSAPLSVDYPASDTAITAAGGTSVPNLLEFCLNEACTPPYYDVTISHEQVWGWDYLNGLCAVLGTPDPFICGTFPGGSGGGVSVYFAAPSYQLSIPGVQLSPPGQSFVYDGQLQFTLPSYFPGRNIPDVSLNADPETGYVIYYTSSVDGYGIDAGYGGTSFVAPQLNGVTALLGQSLRCRIGLLNFPLYELAHTGQAYKGSEPPLKAITRGDNWYYQGSNGYNPAAGLGTMDVAHFERVLHSQF